MFVWCLLFWRLHLHFKKSYCRIINLWRLSCWTTTNIIYFSELIFYSIQKSTWREPEWWWTSWLAHKNTSSLQHSIIQPNYYLQYTHTEFQQFAYSAWNSSECSSQKLAAYTSRDEPFPLRTTTCWDISSLSVSSVPYQPDSHVSSSVLVKALIPICSTAHGHLVVQPSPGALCGFLISSLHMFL